MSARTIEALATRLAHALDMPGHHRRPREANLDWEEWLALVDEHRVGPLLGARRTWERSGPVPTWVREALISQSLRNAHEMVFHISELLRVFRSRPRLSGVVLKGVALALTRYGHSGERVISDVDVLFRGIGPLEEFKEVLLEDGYVASPPSAAGATQPHHHHPPLHHPARGVVFELHENLSTPPLPRPVIQEMIDASVPTGLPAWPTGLRVLDPASQVIHQAMHALDDPVDSPLLRNLLEVGWQLHTMDPFERERVEDLAHRWGLEDRVAEAVHLAHDLFGTPTILSLPDFGARRAWSMLRLGWTGSHRLDKPWARRLSRHLADAHLRRINQGEGERDLLVLASVLSESLRRSASSFITRQRKDRPLERVPALVTAEIGEALLVFDRDSGGVHLLDPLAAEVLLSVEAPATAKHLTEELVAKGREAPTVRTCLELLVERGLLAGLAVGGILPLC